ILSDRGLSPEMQNSIVYGDGADDRSSSLFSAMIRMISCDFSLEEILTVFTNKNYYLGQTAYDHVQSDDRNKAADWLYRFCYIKAFEKVESEKWKADLVRNKDQGIKGTLNNLVLILKN